MMFCLSGWLAVPINP